MRITALDTETTGLWWSHGTSVFSLGMQEQIDQKKPRFIFWNWPINPVSRKRRDLGKYPQDPSNPLNCFTPSELADLRSRFTNDGELVIIQNARFDVKALCELGVFDWNDPCEPSFWKNILDLKHLAHLNCSTDAEFGASLKDLTPKYLERNYQSQDDLAALVQKCRDFVQRHSEPKTLGKRKADKRSYPVLFRLPAESYSETEYLSAHLNPEPLYGLWRLATPSDPATCPGKDKHYMSDYWLPGAVSRVAGSAWLHTSQGHLPGNPLVAIATEQPVVPSDNYPPLFNALLQTFTPSELKAMLPSGTYGKVHHKAIVDAYLEDDCRNTLDLACGYLSVLTERHGEDLERLLAMNRRIAAAIWRMEVTGTPLHSQSLTSAINTCEGWTERLWTTMFFLSGGICPIDSQPTDTQVRQVLFDYFALDSVKQTKNKANPLDSVDAGVLVALKKNLADSTPDWVEPVTDSDGDVVALPEGLVGYLNGTIGSPFTDDQGDLLDSATGNPIDHRYRANLFLGILLASKKHNKKHSDLVGYRTKSLRRCKRAYAFNTDTSVSPLQALLFASYDEAGTATTRLGCREPNLMNIAKAMNPFEKDFPDVSYYLSESPSIRGIFGPPKGYLWYPMDYSQLQLRIFAAASGETSLQQAFLDGWDAHDYMAHRIFNLPDGVKPEDAQRRIAKNVNFGFIFGAGESKIDATAGRPGLYQDVLRLFPNAHKFIERTKEGIRRDGCVYTLGGYPLAIPLRSNKWRPDVLAPAAHAGVNYIVQGTEGEIVKLGIALCHEFLYCGVSMHHLIESHYAHGGVNAPPSECVDDFLDRHPLLRQLWHLRLVKSFDGRMVMQVHDENVFQLPERIHPDTFAFGGSKTAMDCIHDNGLRPLLIPWCLKLLMEFAGTVYGVVTPVDADLVTKHWNKKTHIDFSPLVSMA